MWKRLNSNQMCENFSYKEVFLIRRFLIERFYCIYILLYTQYRCKLMFPSLNTNCLRRGCNYKYDCINHIMQTCRFNYNNIIHRHNYVNDLLITLLNKYKFTTILEPYIRTQLGLRKPDLLAYRNDICHFGKPV